MDSGLAPDPSGGFRVRHRATSNEISLFTFGQKFRIFAVWRYALDRGWHEICIHALGRDALAGAQPDRGKILIICSALLRELGVDVGVAGH